VLCAPFNSGADIEPLASLVVASRRSSGTDRKRMVKLLTALIIFAARNSGDFITATKSAWAKNIVSRRPQRRVAHGRCMGAADKNARFLSRESGRAFFWPECQSRPGQIIMKAVNRRKCRNGIIIPLLWWIEQGGSRFMKRAATAFGPPASIELFAFLKTGKIFTCIPPLRKRNHSGRCQSVPASSSPVELDLVRVQSLVPR